MSWVVQTTINWFINYPVSHLLKSYKDALQCLQELCEDDITQKA